MLVEATNSLKGGLCYDSDMSSVVISFSFLTYDVAHDMAFYLRRGTLRVTFTIADVDCPGVSHMMTPVPLLLGHVLLTILYLTDTCSLSLGI